MEFFALLKTVFRDAPFARKPATGRRQSQALQLQPGRGRNGFPAESLQVFAGVPGCEPDSPSGVNRRRDRLDLLTSLLWQLAGNDVRHGDVSGRAELDAQAIRLKKEEILAKISRARAAHAPAF
jgi:hypothetical protein